MHSIKRSDYSQSSDESGSSNLNRADSLYKCLHVDDFDAAQRVKRPHLMATVNSRHTAPGRSSTAVVANAHQCLPTASAPNDGRDRRLGGVKILLSDLPDSGSNVSASLSARQCSLDVIQGCLKACWEPSTLARYNGILEGAVCDAESALGVELLPCDSDVKLMLLFARFDGAAWGTISANKSAVRAWHAERGLCTVFQSAWTERSCLFWKGFKKRADHSKVRAKRSVYHSELLQFQRSRLDAGTLAGQRDAAIAAVCFYGIRRSAEVLALQVADVSVQGDSFRLLITWQKNDPNGKGMSCWLPKIESLDDLCPFRLLTTWIVCRQTYWPHQTDGPFFCVSSATVAKCVSYDSWRKSINSHFASQDNSVGTHSLRKGGASWLKFYMMMSDAAVQGQGGWASPEVMNKFYASFPDEARHAALEQAFERFSMQRRS